MMTFSREDFVAGIRPISFRSAASFLSQGGGLVELRPEVHAPVSINLGLGSLPLSIGLFAASGAAFLIGSQVRSVKGVTDIAGILAAAGGVLNLVLGGPKAAEAAAPPAAAPANAPPGSSGAVTRELIPTAEEAFAAVSARIVTPENFSTIDVSAFGSVEIPVRVRLENPSGIPASFDLILDMTEVPMFPPFGSEGDPISSSKTLEVTVAPGQVIDVDTTVPSLSPSIAEHVEVTIVARKRRLSGGNPQNLYSTSFVLE